ncbi:MAG: hypothetical protein ACRD2Z_03790 [Thermoanaerobaculia bacterium]
MWCPSCGGEYREGYETCADCGVPLVDARPAGVDARPAGADAPGGVLFPSMPSPVPVTAPRFAGEALHCHNCGHDRFMECTVYLQPTSTDSLGLRDLGPAANVFACTGCGFVHWFLPSALREEPPAVEPDEVNAPEGRASEPLECLSCGGSIPTAERTCPACGWNYG